MSISIDTVTDAIIGKLDAENKALEAEAERLRKVEVAARELLSLHLRAQDNEDVAEMVVWDSAIFRLRAILEET